MSGEREMKRVSAKDRALALAASIVEARAIEIRRVHDRWAEQYPESAIGAATERSAYMECELLARLIRDRMSPSARAALAAAEGRP